MHQDLRPWWETAVIYQIYPKSFADANGDGIGDLRGIQARLGYLRELGVDALWITTWYKSPWADGGYDVEDYRQINPQFGSLAEAEQLIEAARQHGLRVIVDVVPNHVSSEHEWFKAAVKAFPGAPERDLFWFVDGEEGVDVPPNNWTAPMAGRMWARVPDGRANPQWYLHIFAPEQPDLNWRNPRVHEEHLDVLQFWLDRGVGGIRIDSAALLVKDPALPDLREGHDYAGGEFPYSDRDEVHSIYQSWRAVVNEYPGDRVLIGEIWMPDLARFARYLRPDELHMAFNFDTLGRAWTAEQMRESILLTMEAHREPGAPCAWVLANHDVTRQVTRYGREDTSFSFDSMRFGVWSDMELGTRRARAAAMLMAALPGVQYVYQGEELGLPDAELPRDVLSDPFFVQTGGEHPGREGCRVPIPWSSSGASLGFSSDAGAAPWLPMPKEWARLSVEAQEADESSMLALYRQMLGLRRTTFAKADVIEWDDSRDDVLSFTRGNYRCITNFGAAPIVVPRGAVLLASTPLEEGVIAQDQTVWLRC